jgi:hypothetical protein
VLGVEAAARRVKGVKLALLLAAALLEFARELLLTLALGVLRATEVVYFGCTPASKA